MNALLIPIKIERNVTYRKNGNHLELTLAVPKPRKVETAVRKEEDEEQLEGERWKYDCGLLPEPESGKRPEEEQEFEKMIDELESGRRNEENKKVTLRIELPKWRPEGRSVVFPTESERNFNRSDENEVKAAQALFGYLEIVKGALATYLRKEHGASLIHERETPDTIVMRRELERHGYRGETHRKRYPGTVKIERLTIMQTNLLDILKNHLKETRPLQKSARSSK